MDKYHENKLTTFEGVLAFLLLKLDKFAGFKALLAAITKFQGVVNGIKAKSVEIETISAGKTKDKQDAEEALMTLLIPVKCAVLSWAKQKKNNKAVEVASITETKLRNGRDTELVVSARSILGIAEANAAELADYTVSAEMLTELNAKIEAFNAALGDKESGAGARSGARITMFGMFSEADKILDDDIDNMMEMYKAKEMELYNQYFETRQIKNVGLRHKPPENKGDTQTPPSGDQPPS